MIRCCKPDCPSPEINPRRDKFFQKVVGWETPREQGGTNHIVLPERLQVFMCAVCMTRMRSGIPEGQGTLV